MPPLNPTGGVLQETPLAAVIDLKVIPDGIPYRKVTSLAVPPVAVRFTCTVVVPPMAANFGTVSEMPTSLFAETDVARRRSRSAGRSRADVRIDAQSV